MSGSNEVIRRLQERNRIANLRRRTAMEALGKATKLNAELLAALKGIATPGTPAARGEGPPEWNAVHAAIAKAEEKELRG